MTASGPDRLDELLEAALEREPEERSRFLLQACSGDRALRADVEEILARETEEGPFDRLFGAFTGALTDEYVDGISPGERLGPYEVERLVGRGGMGSVFLARRADGQFDQQVAIKVLRRDAAGEEPRRHFLAERQILARLSHPNIARVFDGGLTAGGRPYLVMEYVEGTPIDRFCDARRLGIRERLLLFSAVCGAVHYAHRNMVIHRDLKPGNILVTADGRPKLLDFGVAKLLAAGDEGATLTRTWWLPMTPDYASPEQVRGDPVTTASDVYALGVLLYELLSGHRPHQFGRRAPAEILRVLSEVEPVPPSHAIMTVEEGEGQKGEFARVTPKGVAWARSTDPRTLERRLKGDLDTIVLKALRKEPERRYGGAGDLAADIERYLEGRPVAARPDTVGYRLAKFVRRHRAATAVAATILLSLAGIAATMAVQAHLVARERDRADRTAELLFLRRNPEREAGRPPGSPTIQDASSLPADYCEANPALPPEEQRLTLTQRRLLERAREAVEHIETVADANAAGYFRAVAGCVTSGPAGRGAIGAPYVNPRLASDRVLDVTKPEVLEFEPQQDGTNKLVGVFYTYDVGFEPPFPPPPSLFGVPFDGPLVQRSSGVVFYGLHVSLFTHNPNGIFHAYNPELTCRSASPDDTVVLDRLPCWRPQE
jgi:serine/threonine protein kinase